MSEKNLFYGVVIGLLGVITVLLIIPFLGPVSEQTDVPQVFTQSYDRNIEYRQDWVYKHCTLDSVLWDTTYFYFRVKQAVEAVHDSLKYASFINTIRDTGYVIFEWDTSGTSEIGDMDSAFAYVKPLDVDSNIVANDSTFLTPAFGTTGLDWDVNLKYKYKFSGNGYGAGFVIIERRICGAGACLSKKWVTF